MMPWFIEGDFSKGWFSAILISAGEHNILSMAEGVVASFVAH